MKKLNLIIAIFLPLVALSCQGQVNWIKPTVDKAIIDCEDCPKQQQAAIHAEKQTTFNTVYDGSWVKIGYPGGDPGYQQGVCTDVVIRALRSIDIDLQELIHNDIKANLEYYNKRYTTRTIDRNIDHRRTQNIQSYLTALEARIKTPDFITEYKPGDILFWDDIGHGHTGIVSNKLNPTTGTYYVIHNIGSGAKYDDFLQHYEPTEVYRLSDNHIAIMKASCTFKYEASKDFKQAI